MKVECPRCHTHVEKPATGDPVCPTCGFGGPGGAEGAPAAPAPTGDPGWQPYTGDAPGQARLPGDQDQTMAIVALVLGIVGCCFLGPLAGIPAAIVGGIAMKRAKENPQQYGGYGMALAGLILGIVATVAGLIWLIFVIIGFSAVPDECWVDPESPECEEATGDGGAASYWDAPVPAASGAMFALPLIGRSWHAG